MKPQVLGQRWTTRWDILEAEATRLASELDAGEEEGPGKADFPFVVTSQVPGGLFFFFFFSFIFISWRLITLQYCSGFCHTLT